jgi:DNA mismatch repair protein MutS2
VAQPLTVDNTSNVRFTPGQVVQTPFGKGIVREVRNGGRLAVDVGGRALVINATDVSAVEDLRRERRAPKGGARDARTSSSAASRASDARAEVDLHGLTVEEAVARSERALNDALLQDAQELRLIHGRSGGRIRAALHKWLGEVPGVRNFRVDPQNDGVTIVDL